MTQQEQRHQRWTNDETLAAAVCLEFDARRRMYWKAVAEAYKEEVRSVKHLLADCWTVQSVARILLADKLQIELTLDRIPGVSLQDDILRRSVNHVNWLDIADHFLADE
jgi:hypothetical protein